MKTITKLTGMAVLLLTVSGCFRVEPSSLSTEETEQIKQEVKAAAEPLMTGWASLDGSIAIKSFSKEMAACYDTLLLDYESFRQSWEVYTEARSGITITPVREDFILLTEELVIYTWVGNVEEVMKSGEKIIYKPIRYTNLFKKSDDQWKIIFHQSSGIPVVVPDV